MKEFDFEGGLVFLYPGLKGPGVLRRLRTRFQGAIFACAFLDGIASIHWTGLYISCNVPVVFVFTKFGSGTRTLWYSEVVGSRESGKGRGKE